MLSVDLRGDHFLHLVFPRSSEAVRKNQQAMSVPVQIGEETADGVRNPRPARLSQSRAHTRGGPQMSNAQNDQRHR